VAAAPFKSERITITTDVFRVDIDTLAAPSAAWNC
jgi:hypothetical protein